MSAPEPFESVHFLPRTSRPGTRKTGSRRRDSERAGP